VAGKCCEKEMVLPGMNEERRPQSIDLVGLVWLVEWNHPTDLTHARNLHRSYK